MSGRRFRWRDCLAAAALAVSGTVAALAGEAPSPWSPDPDEQYLLDVNIRQFRMDNGVRAYNTPSGPCVVFGDFVKALDLPIEVDLARRKASGWAIKEANRIEIDLPAKPSDTAARASPSRITRSAKPARVGASIPLLWRAGSESVSSR